MSTHEDRKTTLVVRAQIMRRAIVDALLKLNPMAMMRNPVMFVVEEAAYSPRAAVQRRSAASGAFQLRSADHTLALVHRAVCQLCGGDGRRSGKAQADALRRAKSETMAYRIGKNGLEEVPSSQLRVGDIVRAVAGQMIPGDGEVIEGVASVDESAIPVNRAGNPRGRW